MECKLALHALCMLKNRANSGFRLDYLRVVGYVGQNRDGTPGIVTSRPQ